MQAVSVRFMKRAPYTIVVFLSIFTFFSAPEVGDAGPFEDVLRSIRNSFSHSTQKPRAPQPHRNSARQSNETPPSDASDASNTQASPTPTPVPAPPSRDNVRVAKATATTKNGKNDLPYGIPVPGKQGLVTSPF